MFNATSNIRAVALGFALVVGTAAAHAQAPAAKPAEPTAAHLEVARDVVRASGISRSFSAVIPQYSDQITQTLTRTRPEAAKDLAVVIAALKPEFEKEGEGMVDIAARIYAAKLTEAELKEAAAFFNSAAGKKYVNDQPAILDELVTGMQAWTGKFSTTMLERVRAEMKKKGHQF